MRLSGVKGKEGSVSVLTMMAIPLLVAGLAVVIEVGRIALARARLQAAADRASFAGSAAVAHSLNRVAAENWRIHKAWRDLSRDFSADTQQDHEAARQRFTRYEAERDAAIDAMEEVRSGMADRVRQISSGLLAANAPEAEGTILPPPDIELLDDAVPAEQWGRPGYGSVTGPLYTDPEGVESGAFDALKFLVKRRAPDAMVGVAARQRVRPVLLKRILGEGVEMRAVSASQAFGGSIEGFARKETESLEEAESEVGEDGSDGLYRSALVPAWTLGAIGAGMRH